jgi:Uma2 family endonuclease
MGVMSIAEAWPPAGRPFTVAELDRMPDDGRRYELVDGVLVVSPRPTQIHQVASFRVASALEQATPPGLQVVPEPAVMISADTELDPDVVVVGLANIGDAKVTTPPVLVVEVRSPKTALVDLNTKKAAYERFGADSYWIVVPDLKQPELIAFELRDGRYEQVARVTGDEPFRAERPFPVEVVPARLVAGLRQN